MFSYPFQPAVKCAAEVQVGGRVEITVPFAAGSHVILFVVEEQESLEQDLLAASGSTLGFWVNPLDDEDWNRSLNMARFCRKTRGRPQPVGQAVCRFTSRGAAK